MGNDNCKGKSYLNAAQFGQVYIQTEKAEYFAGETIKGTVYLNLLQYYQGSTLMLKFKGREFVHWVDRESRTRTDGNGNQETYYEDIHRKHKEETHNVEAQLYQWMGLQQIPPGQFCFPFCMVLPPKLAGTFFQKRYQLLADISYHLEAVLHPSNQSQPKLKFKHKININEPPTMLAETQNQTKNVPLTDCCCMGKGNAQLFVSFQKNVYVPGEVANVQLELDNRQATIGCRTIKFSLKQTLSLKTNQHSTEKTFEIVETNASGVLQGEMGQRQVVSLALPQPEGSNLWMIKYDGGVEKVILSESGHTNAINPSTRGSLIRSEFRLDVKCEMNGTCPVNPEISIPIDIHAPILQLLSIAPPMDWNPRMMETFNVPSGQGYGVNSNLAQVSYGNTMGQTNYNSTAPVNYSPNMGVQYAQPNQVTLEINPTGIGYTGNQPLLADTAGN